MAQKYKYRIGCSADVCRSGLVALTPEEAAIVDYALNDENWTDIHDEGYGINAWINTNPEGIHESQGGQNQPSDESDMVTITLQREDAENLLRLLGYLNYYRVGAALSDNPATREGDVVLTTKSVNRAYKAFDDVVGLKWQAVKDEKEEETK